MQGRYFSQIDDVKEIKKCSECGNKIHYRTKTHLCLKCNGKKNRKVVRPSKEELEKLVSEKPVVCVGEMFGVSDNAIREWMRQYGLL